VLGEDQHEYFFLGDADPQNDRFRSCPLEMSMSRLIHSPQEWTTPLIEILFRNQKPPLTLINHMSTAPARGFRWQTIPRVAAAENRQWPTYHALNEIILRSKRTASASLPTFARLHSDNPVKSGVVHFFSSLREQIAAISPHVLDPPVIPEQRLSTNDDKASIFNPLSQWPRPPPPFWLGSIGAILR